MDRFETVLDLNLRDPQARAGEFTAATQLALDTRKAGNPEAAFLCLQHAREHLPDDPTLLLDLGIQAEQVHQLPVAQQAIEAALQLRPNDPQTLYALSRVELDPRAPRRLRTSSPSLSGHELRGRYRPLRPWAPARNAAAHRGGQGGVRTFAFNSSPSRQSPGTSSGRSPSTGKPRRGRDLSSRRPSHETRTMAAPLRVLASSTIARKAIRLPAPSSRTPSRVHPSTSPHTTTSD